MKIGKGLGKLLEAAGLAHEVPDEPEQQGAGSAENEAREAETAEETVDMKTETTASKRGTGPRAKIAVEKPAAADSRLTETLKSGLDQAASSDVYRRFKEHGDALTGFIEDQGKRIQAAAKAAKITKSDISSALSSRMKALDAAVENMRADSLSEIRQKLGKSESELKQVRTSISTKEQELADLRAQADTLDSQITGLRQKVDMLQQRIQAAYEKTRAEISSEQELVKKYLK